MPWYGFLQREPGADGWHEGAALKGLRLRSLAATGESSCGHEELVSQTFPDVAAAG